MIERLKSYKTRRSTKGNYHGIWTHFNKFLIRLDIRPDTWEERVALFCAHLVELGKQSSTIKSYVSAIKHVLTTDGYCWDNTIFQLDTLTKACRVINDRVYIRRPIRKGILEILLFELERIFQQQMYLELLYKAMFVMMYYGMFRVGELATDTSQFSMNHAARAKDVHVGQNKSKIQVVLFTSKTHGKESLPQKIKISNSEGDSTAASALRSAHFCPFELVKQYLRIRGDYESMDELFFVFRGSSPVTTSHFRQVLKMGLVRIGLDESLYDIHSFRIGRTTDLIHWGKSLEYVRRAGRWKSNTVFKYIQ